MDVDLDTVLHEVRRLTAKAKALAVANDPRLHELEGELKRESAQTMVKCKKAILSGMTGTERTKVRTALTDLKMACIKLEEAKRRSHLRVVR